jgi:hypothetical protein
MLVRPKLIAGIMISNTPATRRDSRLMAFHHF